VTDEEENTAPDEYGGDEEDELNTPTDELENLTTEELENFSTEDESGIEELDCTFTLELETTSEVVEEELSPSGSVLLFPLSPPHDAKIRATATIQNNVIRCFCVTFCSLP